MHNKENILTSNFGNLWWHCLDSLKLFFSLSDLERPNQEQHENITMVPLLDALTISSYFSFIHNR